MMSDNEIIELATKYKLTYNGKRSTIGVCARCDKKPPSGELQHFTVSGSQSQTELELGPECLMGNPTTGPHWRAVLFEAWNNEADPKRRGKLRLNLDEMLKAKK